MESNARLIDATQFFGAQFVLRWNVCFVFTFYSIDLIEHVVATVSHQSSNVNNSIPTLFPTFATNRIVVSSKSAFSKNKMLAIFVLFFAATVGTTEAVYCWEDGSSSGCQTASGGFCKVICSLFSLLPNSFTD